MSHDRTGEPVDLDRQPGKWHDPRCRNGWLGDDHDGHPIPCLTCKPHLRDRRPTVNRLKPEQDELDDRNR